jgi:release factor glutamine methyltransferase
MESNADFKPPWTPLKIIQWAVPYLKQKGVKNARFDVESLIAHALNIDRLKVYLQFDRPLNSSELQLIRDLLKRRSQHEPIQYITGQREFFGSPYKVSPSVLIPRPETELLVEKAIDHLKEIPEEKRVVLDLGTGSGCIAISVAKNIFCRIWAVDFSEKALEIARENAANLGVQTIQWRKGAWFSALLPTDPSQFQLIISNPPYIALSEKNELEPEVRDFEPSEALFAGENGLRAYEELSKELKERLILGGSCLLEIHANRYDKVSQLFSGFWEETLYRDLQGLPFSLNLYNHPSLPKTRKALFSFFVFWGSDSRFYSRFFLEDFQ